MTLPGLPLMGVIAKLAADTGFAGMEAQDEVPNSKKPLAKIMTASFRYPAKLPIPYSLLSEIFGLTVSRAVEVYQESLTQVPGKI
jgi:hypothetical protein